MKIIIEIRGVMYLLIFFVVVVILLTYLFMLQKYVSIKEVDDVDLSEN